MFTYYWLFHLDRASLHGRNPSNHNWSREITNDKSIRDNMYEVV